MAVNNSTADWRQLLPQQTNSQFGNNQQENQAPRFKGTGFTNIENVLKAGTAGGMTNALTSNLAQQKTNTLNQLNEAQSAFTRQQDTSNLGSTTSLGNLNDKLNNTIDPTWNVDSGKPMELGSLTAYANGPTNQPYANTTEYNKLGQKIEETRKLANPQISYQPILSQTFGNPNYGAAAKNLDVAFLNKDSNASKALAGTVQGLDKAATNAQQGAEQKAAQVNAENAAYKPKYTEMITNASKNYTDKLDAQRKAATDITSGGITQEEIPSYLQAMTNMGYTKEDAITLANQVNAAGDTGIVGLNNWYNGQTGKASTAQQAAQLDALNKLSGKAPLNEADGKFSFTAPTLGDAGQKMLDATIRNMGNTLNEAKYGTWEHRNAYQQAFQSQLNKLAAAYPGFNPSQLTNFWAGLGLWDTNAAVGAERERQQKADDESNKLNFGFEYN